MPYRDAGDTLGEALGSVLDQRGLGGGVGLEVIAVDDGSTDDGPAIVAHAAKADRRVVPLATGGVGIARALAAALDAARGEVVARMDADDVALPYRFARQLARLASDERLGAIGTRVEAFPDEAVGEGMRLYVAWQNAIETPEEHARELFVEAPLCHPSAMMRREALERAGGFCDVPWAEDYDLWLRLDAHGYRLAKVPEVLLRWRHRPGRATFSNPRYERARFYEVKARYLAPKLARMGRPVAVWGAGPTGRRLGRALRAEGIALDAMIDVDPRKIGRIAQGARILSPDALVRGRHTVVVAVGARGARGLIRGALDAKGFVEGIDYVCAA